MCQNRRVLLAWNYDYTTVLSYISLKSGCRTYLTTHVSRKKKQEVRRHIYTCIFIFLFLILSKLKHKNLDKTKLGSTLLGGSLVKSPFLSRHFLEIKAIWLAFDSLIYFTTEHLFFFRKGGKSSNYPILKD